VTTKPHDALSIPLSERIDYLTVIASMAGADVVLAPEERENLQRLCRELELPDADAAKVLQTAHRPTDKIERHLDALKSSPLRFTLLSDCLALAYADGDYAAGEKKEIYSLARALGVDDAQVAALEECALTLLKASGGAPHHHGHLAQKLAAVGIPIGTIGALSAVGLSTAGVSSGAAAIVMGLGIATGFGAVLGISVGTVMGVRWLHDRLTAE
jgi:uncharacterized tellurite resistance protein B-like protein